MTWQTYSSFFSLLNFVKHQQILMATIVLILFFILQQIIFLYGDIQVVSLFVVETISTYKNSFFNP